MAKKKRVRKETGRVPPPYALAMVVCDSVHRDPGSGKPFLLGCFTVIHALRFPATHPMMGVYIELTNGRGKVPFRAQLVDANEEREPIWVTEDEVDFADPRVVIQLAFMLLNTTFPDAGEYRFQLFACGEFILERRILVNQIRASDE